jgi:SOS-response transcriptional repressor LexA
MNKLKNNPEKTLHPETIGRIETALNIIIDDSDPENITYKRLPAQNEYENIDKKIYNYPLITNVYAGDSPSMFVNENITEYVALPYEHQENCFAVKVIGDSMNHIIQENDIILADMSKQIMNGNIVIARLKSGKQMIKRYRQLNNIDAMFYSDNGSYTPLIIPLAEIEAIYKVVGIWKSTD